LISILQISETNALAFAGATRSRLCNICNPLYVGVSVALCGVALIFALDWILLLILPACVILHFAVVRCEEFYLEQKFGDAYRRYKERVPRYFAGN
jgi:protein-S-isoprenylcysteine O-methyltransferase Ste14